MKISTKGRYALRMVIDLAEHADDGFISLKDIAARQGLSKKYLEQIVPLLNKTGMLHHPRLPGRIQTRKIPVGMHRRCDLTDH